jgi:hypothetical protein
MGKTYKIEKRWHCSGGDDLINKCNCHDCIKRRKLLPQFRSINDMRDNDKWKINKNEQ